jgi:hypothetical protein
MKALSVCSVEVFEDPGAIPTSGENFPNAIVVDGAHVRSLVKDLDRIDYRGLRLFVASRNDIEVVDALSKVALEGHAFHVVDDALQRHGLGVSDRLLRR